MLNKRNIIILTLLLSLGTVVFADSNDLLKMDVKKSSAQDAVDVTFYTTGGTTNSIVSRKSGNSYVVLLPNVTGNQSVVPSLGGVKDLVTDIKVKNVDDGIGGYTKVTFTTSKPIKIQTATKKTAPLTKAQQDYKNLISQNSKFDTDSKMKNFKSTTATQASKPATTQSKPAQTQAQKPAATQTKQNQTPKISDIVKKAQNNTKSQEKSVQTKTEKEVKMPLVAAQNTESKQSAKIDTKQQKVQQNTQAEPTKTINNTKKTEPTKQVEKQPTKNSDKKLPIIPIAGFASVLGIFALGGIINYISRLTAKNSDKIKSIFEENSGIKESKQELNEFDNIISNKKLNWQEKYKIYSDQKQAESQENEDYSYVTDMSTTMKAIISPDLKVKSNIPSLNGRIKKDIPTNNEKEQVQAKISQMEHALLQTPSLKSIVKHKPKVHTEDEAISNSVNNIKLKSFAKNKTLSETSRSILNNNETENKKNNELKENKFVKLRDSVLSMNHRKSNLSITNLSRINNNRPTLSRRDNNGIVKAESARNSYESASLGEYLTILDSEEQVQNTQRVTNAFEETYNSINNVTSPIKKSREIPETINGLKVKSGYNIDSEKGFYIVDINGSNQLIGRIGEEIFVLKEFDNKSNINLQVRLDYDNVYIVRAGSYKCLVDVTEDRMGTLLEI